MVMANCNALRVFESNSKGLDVAVADTGLLGARATATKVGNVTKVIDCHQQRNERRKVQQAGQTSSMKFPRLH